MHSFSILNSRKRAIIALIHTVIFLGVAALQTALSHACGALAAALVGTAEYYRAPASLGAGAMVALILEMLLGYLTFTGSLMAAGKLQEVLPTRPLTYRNQNLINGLLFAITAGAYASMS